MRFEVGDRVRYGFTGREFEDWVATFRSSRGTVRLIESEELVYIQWDSRSDMEPENVANITHVDAVERLADLHDG